MGCGKYCVGALLAAVLLRCGGCADPLILRPSTNVLQVTDGSARRVALGKDRSVEVWTASSPGARGQTPRAFILHFCGNGDRAETALGRQLAQWEEFPVEIWVMNYPGYGGSSGPAQLRAIPAAALAAYDALRARAAGRPIIISAMSLGSTVALYVAAHRPVDGLLIRSPAPVRQVITGNYGWWNLWLLAGPVATQFPDELDSVKNARRVEVPAIFVITGADELVPRKYQRDVTAAYAGKHRVIVAEEARHSSPISGKAVQRLRSDLQWLWSKASAGGPAGASRP